MKRLITFLFIVIIWNSSHSQSIVTQDKSWSNALFIYSTMTLATEHIRFTDDTTINAVMYKRVERSLEETQTIWNFYGYIREDTEKRIYYRTNAQESERLLYDFSLEMGDSVQAFGLMNFSQNQYVEMNYHVTAIDSFQIGDSFRKQWHLSIWTGVSLMEVEQWIDSTGSNSGMLHNWDGTVGGDGFLMLCYRENDIVLYQNPTYNSCYVVIGTNDDSAFQPKITISPNPLHTQAKIEIGNFTLDETTEFYLFDFLGREVFRTVIKSSPYFFKRQGLPDGMYLWKTVGSKGIATGKLVIE